MEDYTLIQLGRFMKEIEILQDKYEMWLQNAEVFIPSQTDPVATICAGGGTYTIRLTNNSG